MGIYSQWVFPRLCDAALGQPEITRLRREVLAEAGGAILEIGFGTGLNLAHYPESVQNLVVVDPNPGMHRKAIRRIAQSPIMVERQLCSGERLPFDDARFDCVVSTFTLCSIANVHQALKEFYRVLRPGGRFLFLEHGLSPDESVRRWQQRLNGLQRLLGDNCHLNRAIGKLIAELPVTKVHAKEFYLAGVPRTHGYIYLGCAIK